MKRLFQSDFHGLLEYAGLLWPLTPIAPRFPEEGIEEASGATTEELLVCLWVNGLRLPPAAAVKLSTAPLRVAPVLAVAVVQAPRLGVGQHFVRFIYLLEAFRGVRLPVVHVGMVFACKLPEGRAHFLFASLPVDAQDLVVVGCHMYLSYSDNKP